MYQPTAFQQQIHTVRLFCKSESGLLTISLWPACTKAVRGIGQRLQEDQGFAPCFWYVPTVWSCVWWLHHDQAPSGHGGQQLLAARGLLGILSWVFCGRAPLMRCFFENSFPRAKVSNKFQRVDSQPVLPARHHSGFSVMWSHTMASSVRCDFWMLGEGSGPCTKYPWGFSVPQMWPLLLSFLYRT